MVSQSMSLHGKCYTIPKRPKVKDSNAIIIGIILVFYYSASVLFDPRYIFSYVSKYFPTIFYVMCESFSIFIHVSTLIGDYLVVARLMLSCVVTFGRHET